MSANHALVFGASGITGWAVVNQIVARGYPSPETFASVTALTNRPLSPEASQWPPSPKLDVVSGVDVLNPGGQAALEEEMGRRVGRIGDVTHVYFFAYVMDPDPEKEVSVNRTLLSRAVRAVEALSPNLRFVVLPTGTKAYGVHLLREGFPFSRDLPLKESLPRVPEPHASRMFYYGQCDEMEDMARGKSWGWCEVVPDVVVGFVPNNNVYSLAQWLGLYLSLVREIEGEGAEVVFPGTRRSWAALSNDASQDVLARAAIAASLRPGKAGSGERYNVADCARPRAWRDKWPVVCAYFGLKGTGPPEEEGAHGPDPAEVLAGNVERWREVEEKYGLVTGRVGNERSFGGFPVFIMRMFDFDRHLDVTKLHGLMGDEADDVDIKGAWYTAFDRYRKAKIIP
ncbi:hypothetical protein N3K66_008439 [Trichothecium roseum]|uniref:Uncharacterized protein n=1 Tax=Trichothecium roseum TaxID=47278 RepID=A0ACC0USQ8_9HYPO|nr:hypothetical protein N3K66_008439 [Trichothecium roseum]